ncbi:MAG: C-type lectin domain-containing protein [Deltaproteobacteria bacterium]|nr:C-type lectin domain-containing protein [Deltaproteobacteria bacterium]
MSSLVLVSLFGCGGTVAATGNQLVRFAAEAPGAHCAQGGVAIETGRDENADGTLQDGEVDAALTTYVCNGATGPSGPAGSNGHGLDSLLTATPEPAGANCAFGGERIDVGIDTNDDGKLETPEITQTTFVCNRDPLLDVHVGDMYIDRAEDLARFVGVRVIGGDLRVRGALGSTLSLPQLEHIAGNLVIDGDAFDNGGEPQSIPGLTTVSLPNLVTVVKVNVSGQHELTTLSLPSLTTASEVLLNDLPVLSAVSLPQLTGVLSGTLQLDRLTLVTQLSLPKVTEADGLVLYANPALATLDLPALTKIHTLFDVHQTKLDRCALGRFWTTLAVRPGVASLRANVQSTCAPADLCVTLPVASITDASVYQCIDSGSFLAADSLCGLVGGHLLWVKSSAEFADVRALFTQQRVAPGWLGYTDAAAHGTWVASGATSYDVTAHAGFWADKEPNSSPGSDCATMDKTGLASAALCLNELPALCRVPK